MEQVVVKYLKYLEIPISEKYCKKIILSHPNYPSLLGVSDGLEQLGIPCKVGRIEEEHLSKVEFPFLIHLEHSREGLVLIKSKVDLSKNHIDLTQWDGIVVKAEPVTKIKDAQHNKEFKKEQLTKKLSITLLVSLVGILATLLFHSFTWVSTLLLGTSIFGLMVGYLLFAKELGLTYKSVESFCNTSTRVNCDKILSSDGANIFRFFSLSQAVFSYFALQIIIVAIVLGLTSSANSYLWVLLTGGAFSIPIVIYSLYYQAVKAKTWCKLCMLVNTVLVLQAVFFSFLFLQEMITIQSIQVVPFVISAFLFLAIAASVVLFKQQNDDASNMANTALAGNRVKYDPEVFSNLLFQGNKVDYSNQDQEMLIGSPTAPIQLLMVANLNCHPCKIGLEHVLELIDQYPNQINVSFKFLMSGNKVHDIPASSFLIRYWSEHISKAKDESEKTRKLIQDWYEFMSTEAFETVYPKTIPTEELGDSEVMESHYNWIRKHDIHRTPTFFVNGFELPANYRINDLGILVAGLVPLLEEKFKTKELVL